MKTKAESVRPSAGSNGYHLKMSKTKTNGVTMIRTIFIFCSFFIRSTTFIGVTGVFSFFNCFHLENQYMLPCTKRNSRKINDSQKEAREYILYWG